VSNKSLCSSDRFIFRIMASSKLNLSQLRQLTNLYKEALQGHYDVLAEEVNVHSIVNKLFQRKVISFELKQAIQKADICISAATMFLDDLFGRCTAERFENFFELLKTDDSESAISHKKLAENVYTDELVAKAKFIANLEESTDSTKEAEHVLADLQPPLTGDSEDVFFNEDNVPSESQQPDSEHSTKASVEVVQYIYPGNSGDDEASDDTFDMSKQEDTEHLLMEPPASTPKGSPHRPIRQGLELDGSMLRIVCRSCWFNLQLFEKRVRPRGTCKIKEHKKVMVTIDHYHGRLVELRPKPASSRTPAVLCKYSWTKCYQYPDCSFAHGILELEYWNGNIDPEKERCLDCLWKHCNTLVNIQCFRECEHPGKHHVIVYKDVHEKSLLRIHYPRNVASMTNKVYRCKHRFLECTAPDRDACSFPHNNVEEQLWNAWKETYYKPGIKVHHLNIESQMKELVGFFKELKSCCVPASMKVFDQPDSGKNNVLATQMLNHHEQANEYKKKFIKLIEAERLVHEGVLKRCNKKCTLTWYKWKDIWSDHNWYLAMIIEQYIADNVRQAATCVILKYQHMSFKADILIPQRFTHEGEPCLILGFEASDTVASPRFSSFYFLSNELMKQNGRLEVDAEFQLKHSYFNNLRKAVSNLPSCVVDRLVDAPSMLSTSTPRKRTLHISPNQCDLPEQFTLDPEYQLPAFEKLLSCPNEKPFVITGPFGTGKTRVIAAAALWLLMNEKESRILIATHHNRTADEYVENYFTEKVMNNAAMKGVRIIRLLADRAVWKFERLRKKFWMLNKGELLHCRLIVTTFITSMKIGSEGNFTHIFVDEGAQAREPECVAAFHCATPQTKIIIAGDHCQVGPNTSVLGEEVRKQGLAVSLLERLHNSYQKANLDSFQAELLTNHRCDSAILRLPSTLFYNCNVKSSVLDQPHPDWKYPLQFVITSLEMGVECKWIKDGELQGAVRAEMEAVKQLVQQCADNWPTGEWGEKDLSLICVMTPTRSSERLWRSTVRNTELANVTVSVTYDIQGLEYRAVFLCTSEPVIDDFKPFDPVKSLCDPRVFNTIITRSQSLVIAFGNPFRPMKIEEQMPEGDKQCWLSYFQRCWENNSIAISNSLNRSHIEHSTALSELEGILLKAKLDYLNNLPKLLKEPPPVDTFEIAYSKIYDAEEMEEEDQSPSKESSHGWKYDQDISSNFPIELQLDKNNARVCKIIEVDADYCIATPVNSSGPSLGIVGPDNRRCALNGATVLVQPRDAGQGAVVAIHSQGDVNPVLCKVDPALPDYFLPVNDKKVKLLNVEDSQKLLKHHLSSEDLVNYHMQRKGYMVCFDPRTVLRRRRITHSIPMDAAGRFLFVVQPLSWDVKERYPRGAAIAIMPKGTTLPLAESLLQIAHQDGFQEDLDPSIQKDAKDRNSLFKFVPQSMPAPDGGFCSSAIGILESDDFSICAFSVERSQLQDCFSIKVHIANLVENMELLEQGHKKDLSVSKNSFVQGPPARGGVEGDVNGGGSIKPNAITLEFNLEITLKENTTILSQVQDKGTLVGQTDKGTLVRQAGNTVDITNLKIGFSESFVSCNYVLSISDLDDMLRGVISGPASHKKISKKLTLHDQIAILYIVARDLHRRRLGHDGYSLFEATSTEYPEVHELFKEFLIQFNHEAAVKLKDSFPDRALLRRVNPQPGRERKLKSIQEDILQIHTYSDMSTSSSSTSKDLLLFPSVVSEVIESLKHLDGVRVKESLCQLYRHPQYIFLLSRLREFLSAEELCVLDNSIAVHSEVAEHYVHKLPLYTSLTSPHQCVADLYVQEGLLAALRETEWKRSAEELMTVAKQSNKAKSKVRFKCLQRNLLLASSAQQSSICVRAIVQKSQEGSPRYCYFQPDSTTADVSQVESFFMPERSTSVRMRVLSSQGLPLQSFKQVVDSSSNLPSFGFFVADDDCSGFTRVLVTGDSPPSTLRLSKPTLRNLNECIHSTADSRRLIEKLERMLTPGDQQKSPPSILFTALEGPFPTVTDISFHVVRLWLGCDPMSHVLSVQPQCMELASGVKVCLQHRRDPLSCFTQHPTEKASKLLYNSIDEYRALWSKAILAVSAEHAVNSCTSSLVYKDVVLAFSKFIIPPKILTPEMYVPVGEITASFTKDCICTDFFTIGEGDFACVRYEIDLNQEQLKHLKKEYQDYLYPASGTVGRAVLHMVVDRVTHKNEAVQVKFTAAGTQPLVSPLMKEILQKSQFPCEVEVITMPSSLRNCLQLLSSKDVVAKASECALHVAMGNLRQLLSRTKGSYFDFIKYLTDQYHSFRALARQLSQAQWNAVNVAMKHAFQLIHSSNGAEHLLGTALVVAFALLNKEQSTKEPTIRSRCKCVLYCCPDEDIASEVADSLGSRFEDIRVLLVNSRQSFCAGKEIFGENAAKMPPRITGSSQYSLISRVRRMSSHAKMIREMENKIYLRSESNKFPSLSQIAEYQQYIWKAEKEILSQGFDIVVCTASEASSERIRRYFQPVQVVVYNASMITEPETFSAIHQALHVILIGNHHQHPPLLNSDVSAQNGMNVSLFERLYKKIEDEYDGEVAKCPLLSTLK
jgi:hypothetical protein